MFKRKDKGSLSKGVTFSATVTNNNDNINKTSLTSDNNNNNKDNNYNKEKEKERERDKDAVTMLIKKIQELEEDLNAKEVQLIKETQNRLQAEQYCKYEPITLLFCIIHNYLIVIVSSLLQ